MSNTLRDRLNRASEGDKEVEKKSAGKPTFRTAITSMIAANLKPNLLQKSDTLRAELLDGGLLLPEEASDFLRKAVNNSALLQAIRVQKLSRPNMGIPKLTINQFIVKPHLEGNELSIGDRSSVDLSQLDIDLIRERVQMDITLDVLEDNIEGDGILQTIEDHMFETLGANLDDILLTANKDDLDVRTGLAFTAAEQVKVARNGLIKLAIDGGQKIEGTVTRSNLIKLIKEVSPKYRRRMNGNQGGMMFIMNPDDVLDLKEAFGDRETIRGDVSYLDGLSNFAIEGVPVLEDDNMPIGYVIYTNPKNVVWAASVHDMRIDRVFRAELGVFKVVTRLYYGFDFQEIEGAAILIPEAPEED
jgi:HK97 family phage major capsid protein